MKNEKNCKNNDNSKELMIVKFSNTIKKRWLITRTNTLLLIAILIAIVILINSFVSNIFIQIKNNLFVWNIKEFCIYNKKNKNKIIKKIKEVKKIFNYILIDMQNFFSLKIYEEIIQKTIFIII